MTKRQESKNKQKTFPQNLEVYLNEIARTEIS